MQTLDLRTTGQTKPAAGPPEAGQHGSAAPLLLIGIAVVGIAWILRTQNLSDLSLTFDECCSWKISQFRTRQMLDAIARDAHPPLYYFVLKLITVSFGNSVTVLRGFSVIMGLLSVVAGGFLIGTLMPDAEGGPTAARTSQRVFAIVLGMGLMTLSSLQIEMSMEARPYTLGTFLSLVAAVCLVRAVRSAGSIRDWVCFTMAAIALSFTHYYCLFTIAALYLSAFLSCGRCWNRDGWSRECRRLFSGTILSMWVVQLVWLLWMPTFQFQLSRSNVQLWQPPLSSESFGDTCFRALAGGRLTTIDSSVKYPGLIIWGGISLWALFHRNREFRLIGILALAPIVGVVVYAIAVRNILGVRYLIFAQTYVLLAAALLTAQIPGRFVKSVAAAVLVMWAGLWTADFATVRSSMVQAKGVSGAVEYLEQRRRDGEPIVVGSPFVHPIVQKYARNPDAVYTIVHGNHRRNILSGPALRESEYWNAAILSDHSIERIWAIDSYGIFNSRQQDEVILISPEWNLETQEEFREPNGLSFILAVRSYTRGAREPGSEQGGSRRDQ